MSSIPSNLARVPNSLMSHVMLGTLNRTSGNLLQTQIQLATGRLVNRPSDNSVAASTISVLDNVIERREQRIRNYSHGEALLNNIDAALSDVNNSLIEVKGIALSEIGFGSDAQTRSNQAKVIDAMLQNLISISNRQYQDIYFFGGKQTSEPPIRELLGGLRYTGRGEGLTTDFGLSNPVAITLSAEQAFGALSSRIEGDVDLDPTLTGNTRLLDLNGARGLGVNLGVLDANVGGTLVSIDLTKAHTVQDVLDTLQTGLQTVDPGITMSVLASGNALEISGNATTVSFSDPAGATTAADLGLLGTFPIGGLGGVDVNPKLTDLTPVSSLTGVTLPLGTIRVTNAGQSREIDLSGAQTIQDIKNAIESVNIGVRVVIAESGDRLNVINELSGGELSISEVSGGTTATQLGLRSFTSSTSLADFNNGQGVDIVSGQVDPISGLSDPARNVDFVVTLRDGSTFDVDLTGATTVQDVLDSMNAAAGAAGLGGTGLGDPIYITLAFDGNGLMLNDGTGGGGSLTVAARNNSNAAENLGILSSTTSASLVGEDRAMIATESVFAHLIGLRDALEANDTTGIEIAAGKLEADILQVAEARADVGVRSRRIADSSFREEDLRIQDIALRSQVQDLDYTEASLRFSMLQQQLQAGLISASQSLSLSLMDFLR